MQSQTFFFFICGYVNIQRIEIINSQPFAVKNLQHETYEACIGQLYSKKDFATQGSHIWTFQDRKFSQHPQNRNSVTFLGVGTVLASSETRDKDNMSHENSFFNTKNFILFWKLLAWNGEWLTLCTLSRVPFL